MTHSEISKLPIAERFVLLRDLLESFPDLEGVDYTLQLDMALRWTEKAEAEFESRDAVLADRARELAPVRWSLQHPDDTRGVL